MQFILYVLGPFLLLAGIGGGALAAGLGYYRDKKCSQREVANKDHEKWLKRADGAISTVLYTLYVSPNSEGLFEQRFVAELEVLRETMPLKKELSQ